MAPYNKTIVCLANSRKLAGRCVAGKEWTGRRPGAWIRPVGASGTGEVSEEERRYEDGADPVLGDVIDIRFLAPAPKAHQTENHELDGDCYWDRQARITWADLAVLADRPALLWENGNRSYNGLNDRLPEGSAAQLGSSLYLLRLPSLMVHVLVQGAAFADRKRKVRGSFRYAGAAYNLTITDPIIEREYLAQPDGDYSALMAMSMSALAWGSHSMDSSTS